MPELERILFKESGERELIARPFIKPETPHQRRRLAANYSEENPLAQATRILKEYMRQRINSFEANESRIDDYGESFY